MINYQSGVLGPVPLQGRYLTFRLTSRTQARRALRALDGIVDGDNCVVGLGLSLLRALDCTIHGMRRFPASANKGAKVPSTPAALWCWLRGADRGDLFKSQPRACTHARARVCARQRSRCIQTPGWPRSDRL